MAVAKHHMLDVLELTEGGFNRNMYYDGAKKVIDKLHAEGKVPIVVGGTNYYVETLLFDVDLLPAQEYDEEVSKQHAEEIAKMMEKSLEEKYKILKEVDELMANKIHKNDQHRIDSYLKKFIVTGKKPS